MKSNLRVLKQQLFYFMLPHGSVGRESEQAGAGPHSADPCGIDTGIQFVDGWSGGSKVASLSCRVICRRWLDVLTGLRWLTAAPHSVPQECQSPWSWFRAPRENIPEGLS